MDEEEDGEDDIKEFKKLIKNPNMHGSWQERN
jgi:hypothetical protein